MSTEPIPGTLDALKALSIAAAPVVVQNRAARSKDETYEEYVSRIIGAKGEAVWHEFTDTEKISFLSETLGAQTLTLQKVCGDLSAFIPAFNVLVMRVDRLEKNRFGMPSKKHR
jgi:hypothetical protein